MKVEIEAEDIEAIAERVLSVLRPLIERIEKRQTAERDHTIFDVKGLAQYLQADSSWVYKQVSLRGVPFFRVDRYCRFRKREVDRWIES